ncbi:hypothetical protein G7046_g7304 [Stylonectria norvegica]|nr:hypothetical protein G7046_g7304 [Stylonectria norvegica]
MSNSLPPDLRVLCRKLTSLAPAQLPHSLPSLINHVLHCKEPLSAPQEAKLKDNSTESSQLVHKLKASITTLLNGRSREGRFAAVGLIKAVVDVGGWEVLRGSQPWVSGLLSIVQKSDPIASKELAVVTLTRIYMLILPYQTLVREIATPTIPAFIAACVALIKRPASGEPLKTPLCVVETICDAFSALVPLYSTTLRPYSSQIKTATRQYLAPTQADDVLVPQTLQRAARRLVVLLHHVAAKTGGSDEWAKLVDTILKDLHATADQVLRAVDESWEGSNGYSRSRVEPDGVPHGGGTAPDQLPPWTGLDAGAERLIGLFRYLSDCLRYPTKAAVKIPTSALLDAVSRVCLVARLSTKSQTWDQALQTNGSIGREEKDELWSLMPEIHKASFYLVLALTQRLGQNIVPFAPEVLDHLVRVFKSGMNFPAVRMTGYTVLKELLEYVGPTLSKTSVDMLDPLVGACCRDLQQGAGHLKQARVVNTDIKNNSVSANADMFLQTKASAVVDDASLQPDHKAAAATLLAILPSRLPQRHLKPSLRGLLDQTAIVTGNRDAMFASVLNPYKDQRGRVYPSILPHFSQQFPNDQGLEILRTNLRTVPQGLSEGLDPLEELPVDGEEEEDEAMEDREEDAAPAPETTDDLFKAGALPTTSQMVTNLSIQSNPFDTDKSTAGDAKPRAASPPKRKHDGSTDSVPPKRQVVERSQSPTRVATIPAPRQPVAEAEVEVDDDDDDDESVHLNMELEEDDDDDDEE